MPAQAPRPSLLHGHPHTMRAVAAFAATQGWLWAAPILLYCLGRTASRYLLSTGFPGVRSTAVVIMLIMHIRQCAPLLVCFNNLYWYPSMLEKQAWLVFIFISLFLHKVYIFQRKGVLFINTCKYNISLLKCLSSCVEGCFFENWSISHKILVYNDVML